MGRFSDLSGKRFGLLTVVKPTGEVRNNYIEYLCRCACGTVALVNGAELRRGGSKSCGCLKDQLSSKRLKKKPIWKLSQKRSAA